MEDENIVLAQPEKIYEHYNIELDEVNDLKKEYSSGRTKRFDKFAEYILPSKLKERKAGKFKMTLYYDSDFPAYILSFEECDTRRAI